MVRLPVLLSLVLIHAVVGGCSNSPKLLRPDEFGPSKLRIHPTFTQVKDLNGDKQVDGLEAVVELLDSFDEPTRGNGTILFELWTYKKYDPDPRGKRVGGPWKATLLTRQEQDTYWSPALRAYTIPLADDKINEGRSFVLTASFEPAGGADKPNSGRLFDRLILEPPPEKRQEEEGVGRAKGTRR